jgi:hypothetical protein
MKAIIFSLFISLSTFSQESFLKNISFVGLRKCVPLTVDSIQPFSVTTRIIGNFNFKNNTLLENSQSADTIFFNAKEKKKLTRVRLKNKNQDLYLWINYFPDGQLTYCLDKKSKSSAFIFSFPGCDTLIAVNWLEFDGKYLLVGIAPGGIDVPVRFNRVHLIDSTFRLKSTFVINEKTMQSNFAFVNSENWRGIYYAVVPEKDVFLDFSKVQNVGDFEVWLKTVENMPRFAISELLLRIYENENLTIFNLNKFIFDGELGSGK